MSKCEFCDDTGYYGDNGPGIAGNTEWHPCDECEADPTKCECFFWCRVDNTLSELNMPPMHHPHCNRYSTEDELKEEMD